MNCQIIYGKEKNLVFTIKERCRVCYTCVRECPAKAIKIANGQAEVIAERCIGCGNCIKVCSQDAKVFREHIDEVAEILKSEKIKVAILAPSFPAEFTEIADFRIILGMVKALGFDYVMEVAFGADLVAEQYNRKFSQNSGLPFIAANCPAIVSYIEYYYPDLVDKIAEIASPMVAMSRVVKNLYSNDVQIVFIGPCIAKKSESKEVTAVITFRELRKMFIKNGITTENVQPYNFDSPVGGKGATFSLSRGMLQSIDISESIFHNNIIVAEGRMQFQEAIKGMESNMIDADNLELLCCEGCIMGPGMTYGTQKYIRRKAVSDYVVGKMKTFDEEEWKQNMKKFSDINLSQTYTKSDHDISKPSKESIRTVLESFGKYSEKDYLNCGVCGYDSCEEHAIAIINGFAENEMCLPYTIEKLHCSNRDLEVSNEKLANTQLALLQSEKLANLGQLSAGIAHELNNPLGVITMYSNILLEETPSNSSIRKDLALIIEQSERCRKIVGGLLNFARKNQVSYSSVNAVNMIKHCIETSIVPNNIEIEMKSSLHNEIVEMDYEQMVQVFINLIKNACEAITGKGKISIEIYDSENDVMFSVEDTGSGIPKEQYEKIFTPFFTTKGIGKGTGLGLPIIYGIVKMHKGNITFNSNCNPEKGNTGTKFIIQIPKLQLKQ